MANFEIHAIECYIVVFRTCSLSRGSLKGSIPTESSGEVTRWFTHATSPMHTPMPPFVASLVASLSSITLQLCSTNPGGSCIQTHSFQRMLRGCVISKSTMVFNTNSTATALPRTYPMQLKIGTPKKMLYNPKSVHSTNTATSTIMQQEIAVSLPATRPLRTSILFRLCTPNNALKICVTTCVATRCQNCPSTPLKVSEHCPGASSQSTLHQGAPLHASIMALQNRLLLQAKWQASSVSNSTSVSQ